jgi:DNA-binding response OmpR family regulator
MNRILVIDQDRRAAHTLGLACLDEGIGVAMADNVCEGVRMLLADTISLVLVEGTALRLTPRESATLFDRVAPGVPVVVMVRPETELSRIVALELAGFRVVTKPVTVHDVLAKVAVDAENRRK